MNIKRKLLIVLFLSLIFVLCVATLTACNKNTDPNQFVTDQGNTIKVQLDSLKSGVLDYRLKPGSPIPEPGKTSGTTAPVAEGYIFDGYYEGTKAEDGSIIYGNKWDFSRKVTEDITLYGKWQIQYKIHINFVIDGKLQERSDDVNVPGNAMQITSLKEPSWTGNTFVQMYTDKECTQELVVSYEQPFVHGCTQESPVCNVYAKFMEGMWTLVRNTVDLRTISAGDRLYLLDDIDMSSLTKDDYTDMTIAANFSGVIEGNGHKISNLNYYRKGTTGREQETNYSVGLFARVINATIRNVTFENCSVQGAIGQSSGEYFYGFIAGMAQGECTFENITFVNCQLKPLIFDFVGGLTAEQETAERAKIEQGIFVGEGSDYLPKIVESDTQTNVVAQFSHAGVELFKPKGTKVVK